ncbi:hypothetical protein [Geoalkalibacter sp.]|uniref:hypothetical protein n=1 Tax=Geoalkalibacter sp. TaxID=3041440 RepID=UPI00272DE52A|nr:hypothetical protein [Geoalkalibacter sp.]
MAWGQFSPLESGDPGLGVEDSGLRFGPTAQPRSAPQPPPESAPPEAPEMPAEPPTEEPIFVPPVIVPPPESRMPSRAPASQPSFRPPASSGQPAPAPAELKPFAGPLQRLNEMAGRQDLTMLLDQFRRPVANEIVQRPAIAVADGETPMRLILQAFGGATAPNLVLTNLSVRRLFRGVDGRWVLEALPQEDAWDASVFVIAQGQTLKVPVVIAPLRDIDFDGNGRVDEADFQLFRQGGADPRFDLNGDGKRDAVDDYIFLANYLLRTDPQFSEALVRR